MRLLLLAALSACRFGFDHGLASDATSGTSGDTDGTTLDGDAGGDATFSGDDAALADGGWKALPSPPTTSQLWGAYAFSSTSVWVAGELGEAFFYDGATWTARPSGAVDTMFYFWGSASDLWLVGRGCTIKRWTGAMWTPQVVASCVEDLYSVNGVAANNVWATGVSGTIVKWNGTSWTAESQGNDDLWSTSIESASDIWISGAKGTLLHWNGASYTAATGIPNVTITSVWRDSPTSIWAVGMAGTILHNTGAGWSQVASPTTLNLYGIVGRSSTDIWAVGQAGTLVHFDGTWQAVTSPTTSTLRNITRVPGGGFIASGDNATVLARD